MKIILDYNRTIFDPESGELYPGVFDLLKMISQNHDLFLISKNEPGREDKFEELNIKKFFKRTVFVGKKTPELFLELVGEDKNVLVVGDRVKGEILIGNTLGLITVWVRQGKFAKELPVSPKEEPRHSIEDIAELRKIIFIYGK